MPEPNVTGRKYPAQTLPASPQPPLLVDVIEARRMLGNMSKNKFWALARAGAFELVGSERKRFVVVASLHRYVANLQRRTEPTA
jgi:hypothetical protein